MTAAGADDARADYEAEMARLLVRIPWLDQDQDGEVDPGETDVYLGPALAAGGKFTEAERARLEGEGYERSTIEDDR